MGNVSSTQKSSSFLPELGPNELSSAQLGKMEESMDGPLKIGNFFGIPVKKTPTSPAARTILRQHLENLEAVTQLKAAVRGAMNDLGLSVEDSDNYIKISQGVMNAICRMAVAVEDKAVGSTREETKKVLDSADSCKKKSGYKSLSSEQKTQIESLKDNVTVSCSDKYKAFESARQALLTEPEERRRTVADIVKQSNDLRNAAEEYKSTAKQACEKLSGLLESYGLISDQPEVSSNAAANGKEDEIKTTEQPATSRLNETGKRKRADSTGSDTNFRSTQERSDEKNTEFFNNKLETKEETLEEKAAYRKRIQGDFLKDQQTTKAAERSVDKMGA